MANVPTTSWDETSPPGSQSILLGDNRIRELKTQIREVIDVDHDFPSSGQAADNGQHKRVTLQEQADLGTGAVGTTILGSQTIATKGELVYTDEDDNDIQLTKAGFAYPSQSTTLSGWAVLFGILYPVGSLYISTLSTNPADLLGIGTWTAFGAGRVLVGRNSADADFDTAEETGGNKTVTLTETELPAHTHNFYGDPGGSVNAVACANGVQDGNEKAIATSSTGSGSAFSIMNPYIVTYMWKRTA